MGQEDVHRPVGVSFNQHLGRSLAWMPVLRAKACCVCGLWPGKRHSVLRVTGAFPYKSARCGMSLFPSAVMRIAAAVTSRLCAYPAAHPRKNSRYANDIAQELD